MHTAARMTMQILEPLRQMNRDARFCVFGLYARLNEAAFRKAGAYFVLRAEFEEELTELAVKLSGAAGV